MIVNFKACKISRDACMQADLENHGNNNNNKIFLARP